VVPANAMVHRPQKSVLALLVLALTACTPALEYPPPTQKTMPKGADPLPGPSLVHIGGPMVDSAIVRDVLGAEQSASWRWTNQHPRLKIWFHPGQPSLFYLRFTLAGVVLKQTGPVTLRMIVNDQVLDTRTFDKEREYVYSKPLPPGIAGSGDSAVVGLDIDPVYISERDGAKLGVLLQDIGFKQAGEQ
jgi:hypothetical protein